MWATDMSITKFNNTSYNFNHPFKVGIRSILNNHFSPSIADRFELILEIEKYALDPARTKNLINQKEKQQFMCEVYYREGALLQYICDVASWWEKEQVEMALLKYITDKLRTGSIGKYWVQQGGKVSEDVSSAKYETPNEEITKDMPVVRMKKKGVKNKK